jgi:hypothetical protein
LVVVIDINGHNGIVPTGGLAPRRCLRPANDAAGPEISVQVLGIMRELVLQDIHICMIDLAGLVGPTLVISVVLIVGRVGMSRYLRPIGEVAVDDN